MRFWGKLLTTSKDYYIAEGLIDQSNRMTRDKFSELPGKGCNQVVFWVTNESSFLI